MTRYLTPHDVADMLQISYEKALRLMKYTSLETVKIGRQYRVSEKALAAFLDRNTEISIGVSGESR